MTGETDLPKMLATLNPILDDCRYVFASLSDISLADAAELNPIATFVEAEGLTVVCEPHQLDTATDAPHFARITLSVHSSLEAVGLTAAVATALTKHGISANVIAAAFHDHLFVPWSDAETAMSALKGLSSAPNV